MKDHPKNVRWMPGMPYQPDRASGASAKRRTTCGHPRSRVGLVGRSGDGCIPRNPYCAFEGVAGVRVCQYVRRMASPGAVVRVIAGLPIEL